MNEWKERRKKGIKAQELKEGPEGSQKKEVINVEEREEITITMRPLHIVHMYEIITPYAQLCINLNYLKKLTGLKSQSVLKQNNQKGSDKSNHLIHCILAFNFQK